MTSVGTDYKQNAKSGSNISEMRAFLEATGYRRLYITNKGLVPSKMIVPVKNERDWLFTTRTAAELSALGYPVLDEV